MFACLQIRETVPNEGEKTFSPSVVEARVGVESYDILSECSVDFDFDSVNKGFEGGECVAVCCWCVAVCCQCVVSVLSVCCSVLCWSV